MKAVSKQIPIGTKTVDKVPQCHYPLRQLKGTTGIDHLEPLQFQALAMATFPLIMDSLLPR